VGTLGSMVALEQYAICYYRRYRLALCLGASNHKLFISKKEVKSALNLWTLGLIPKRQRASRGLEPKRLFIPNCVLILYLSMLYLILLHQLSLYTGSIGQTQQNPS